MMFWDFFPAGFHIEVILWFAFCAGLVATLIGGMFGTINKPHWQRGERRRQAEAQAAATDPAGRFCCNCRWARWSDSNHAAEWKCAHPSSMRAESRYLANGENTPDNMHTCALIRDPKGAGTCGAEGRFWERKTP